MSVTLSQRPIFVIGPERSGTTLVMAMLGNHPHIAVPEQSFAGAFAAILGRYAWHIGIWR